MAEVLHGSARTTPRVRAELQRSQASTRALAARYGLNPKTVAKWRGRTTTGPAFLRNAVAAFPYRIRIVLTDNGTPFADLPKNRSGPTARLRGHMFDRVCREHGIEHRLTKPYHPWTNGQAERMNRTIKDATREGVPLREPGEPQGPRPRLRRRLQLRQAPQGAAMANTLRSHPGRLDQ